MYARESGSNKTEDMGGRHRKCLIYFPNYFILLLYPGNQTFFAKWNPRKRDT